MMFSSKKKNLKEECKIWTKNSLHQLKFVRKKIGGGGGEEVKQKKHWGGFLPGRGSAGTEELPRKKGEIDNWVGWAEAT